VSAIATDARTAAVTDALREAGQLGSDERIESITHLAGGWSRHSYVASGPGPDGPRRFVVRVCPPGALLDTELETEYRLYQRLDEVAVPTPRPYAYVDAPTPFDGPFVVMEYVAGRAPNCYSRTDWARHAENWNGPRTIANETVENLARIHAIPTEALPDGLPAYDFDAAVARWRDSYDRYGLVRDPVVEAAFAWIAERRPADTWTGLVHGDYRLDNMLLADGHVRSILDWELAYCGDVRYDLGYLALPRTAGKHLAAVCPLMATFAEESWFMGRYAELTGRAIAPEDLATFVMLGIMMLLSTQFTAAWMYVNGRTTDMRMAWSRFSFAGLRQDMIGLMQW
jgi:aminoglycoside phosphotransferase (APT) family kinase protein